jgi:hypothetical protein
MLSDPLLVGIAHAAVFAVGYLAAKRTLLLTAPGGASTLRLAGGCILGLILGGLAGGLASMFAYTLLSPVLQHPVSSDSLFLPLIGKSFLFAGIGSAYTALSIRKQTASAAVRPGRVGKEGAKPGLADNDSYAEALSEIDENRVDKGTWARCYAISEGDESKTKAAYIKVRAEAARNALVWEDTQPPIAINNRAETFQSSTSSSSEDGLPKWGPAVIAFAVIAGVIGLQQYSSRQTAAANVVQVHTPQLDISEFKPVEAMSDTQSMQEAGVGGSQDLSDITGWGRKLLESRGLNGSSLRQGDDFSILWQRQIVSRLGDSPEHALFLAYKLVANFYDQHEQLCRPDMNRDGGILDRGRGEFEAFPQCFAMN